MPACIKTGTPPTPRRAWFCAPAPVTLDVAQGCVPWIFANAGAQGYYRTAYAPEMLRALAPHVADALTAPERLTLIDDEWALVRANRHTAADYLTLAAGYGRESSSGVLGEVTERLDFIHRVPDDRRDAAALRGVHPDDAAAAVRAARLFARLVGHRRSPGAPRAS